MNVLMKCQKGGHRLRPGHVNALNVYLYNLFSPSSLVVGS